MASQHQLYLALWTNSTAGVIKWRVVIQTTDPENNTRLDAWGAINFGLNADEFMLEPSRPVQFRNTDVIAGAIDIGKITPAQCESIIDVLDDIGVERPDTFERAYVSLACYESTALSIYQVELHD